jgi:hypothetical protein
MKYWEITADNLSNAGWSWGWSQRLIPTGERFGLLMRTAATESVSLCADENPELRFDHTLICRERADSHGKAYASYRGVPFNDCFLRNSHARALIESATRA